MTTLYGIPNCDSVKRARAWLDAAEVAYRFHDYKKAGIDADRLRGWIARLGLDTVLNRAGTTYRKLPEADRAGLDSERAIALMIAQPSLIKRPIVESGETLFAGFDADRFAAAFAG